MSSFSDALKSGKFIVTAELNPPKGTDLTDVLGKASKLKGKVAAFNLTDSASAIMTMAPMAVAYRLKELGMEPILQLTSRDRNRIAVQGDLLAAANLGVSTVVCMGGDPPQNGDNPEAKPVFDLDTIALIKLLVSMDEGKDLAGHDLKGKPEFTPGAVCNPGASDLDKEIQRMQEKVDAGAKFFQTQAVYDVEEFARFMERAEDLKVPVIAGFIVLKSGDMARRLNATLPGVHVPDNLIEEMDAASNKSEKSIEIAGRVIADLKSMARGTHIMAIGWENRIPAMLAAAGIE
jgi:methylenetetrahydrofolate reductase (NADPH)